MSTYTETQWDRAVATARDALEVERQIVRKDFWAPMHIVLSPSGRLEVYSATAWEEPVQTPLLPWSAPQGDLVAVVQLDGSVEMASAQPAQAA